jgi:hypothetical protein
MFSGSPTLRFPAQMLYFGNILSASLSEYLPK